MHLLQHNVSATVTANLQIKASQLNAWLRKLAALHLQQQVAKCHKCADISSIHSPTK